MSLNVSWKLRCQICSEGQLVDCSTQVARHRKMPARPVLIEDEVECSCWCSGCLCSAGRSADTNRCRVVSNSKGHLGERYDKQCVFHRTSQYQCCYCWAGMWYVHCDTVIEYHQTANVNDIERVLTWCNNIIQNILNLYYYYYYYCFPLSGFVQKSTFLGLLQVRLNFWGC